VLSLAFFPGWLQRIEQRLSMQLGPIHMVSDSFRACEELMLHRRVQFLLCYGHPAVPTRLSAPEFEFTCVGTDLLVPVAAPDPHGAPQHPIRGLDEVPVSFLAYSEESWLGQIMRVRMGKVYDPMRFKPVVTSHHTGLLKNLALGGRGLAWLPQSLIHSELADGRLVAADRTATNDEWRMPVEIQLFRVATGQSPVAEALWQQIKEKASAPKASGLCGP
jgi:LysR family transcriptional regulator, hypochlorite-specific transcription factor HypT